MKRVLIILTTIFLIGCDEDPTMYTLTVSSNPTEGGTINPSSGEYEEGTEVTLRVNTNTHYEFDKWSGGWSGSESPLTLTMDSDKNIVGNFKLMDSDGDGVTDDIDQCNDTPSGQTVDPNGCSDSQKDTDGDGVSDDMDNCVDVSNTNQEDFDGDGIGDGCDDDIDNDGYSNDVDECNNTVNGRPVNTNGCQNPIYLDENGVTVKSYDWGNLGDVGVIDGVEYLIVDKPTLKQMILNGQDVSKVCTTFILDFNSLLDHLVNQGPNHENLVSFNQDISSWDVSNVTTMRYTFWFSNFNQDISSWDVSNVTNMKYMFYESRNFNQDLSNWNVDKVHGCEGFSFHRRGNNVWTLPKPNFTDCNPN